MPPPDLEDMGNWWLSDTTNSLFLLYRLQKTILLLVLLHLPVVLSTCSCLLGSRMGTPLALRSTSGPPWPGMEHY